MLPLERVLFPTDFSTGADQAFAWALELARAFDAELHIFHGLVLRGTLDEEVQERIDGLEAIANELEATALRRIDSLAHKPSAEVTIKRATRRGLAAAPLIRDYIDEHDIGLTILGTHGRRNPAHALLGSVAEEVVRIASSPVFTVREREHPTSLKAIERILVPLDLSRHSVVALDYARELASVFDAKLQLLHVVERPVYPSFYALKQSSLVAMLGDIEARAKTELDKEMHHGRGPAVPFETYVSEGPAVAAILDFAKTRRSDVIVMTTHGQTALKRFFLGGVAEKVVRRATLPVLTVKSFGRSSASPGTLK